MSSLWIKIADPSDEWPEWGQPVGAHDAYGTGDKVSHNGWKWVSTAASNVWEPGGIRVGKIGRIKTVTKEITDMKESILKGVFVAALAGAAAYFRELVLPVVVLAAVMSVDYISGMVSAWIMGELSSRVGVIGIIKKAAYLLAVVVAIVADWIVQTAAGKVGVDFGGFYFFGLLVTIWLILNECISILENVSEIGVPLPAFLLCIVQRLKRTVENDGEEAADHE